MADTHACSRGERASMPSGSLQYRYLALLLYCTVLCCSNGSYPQTVGQRNKTCCTVEERRGEERRGGYKKIQYGKAHAVKQWYATCRQIHESRPPVCTSLSCESTTDAGGAAANNLFPATVPHCSVYQYRYVSIQTIPPPSNSRPSSATCTSQEQCISAFEDP